MDNLPINVNHPAVREYLALIRLQVLTPLSLLINIATIVICATLSTPTIGQVSNIHRTAISPKAVVIGVYILVIFAGQIGYCLLLVLARKNETKKTLTSKGIGLCLVLANWTMALWAIVWVLGLFRVSAVLQGILLGLLIYSNAMLLIFHPPTSERPFDMILIHAPMRFFLVLELVLMFPLSLFVALGLEYSPRDSRQIIDYETTSWPGFAVVLGTNLLGLIAIASRQDLVWAISAAWICSSMWSFFPKPATVFITAVIFTILHPLTFLASVIYAANKPNPISLPADDSHPGLYRPVQGNVQSPDGLETSRGPREVDEAEVWG